MHKAPFDIAIIGGGLVGMAMARALAEAPVRVVLLDKVPAQQLCQSDNDNRGLALSHTSVQFLTSQQIWDPTLGSHPITRVHVSEQGKFGFAELDAAAVGLQALGHVVAAPRLAQRLHQSLLQQANLTLMRPCTLKMLSYNEGQQQWTIGLSEGCLNARLLIAADGTRSWVRQAQGIDVAECDYHQHALVSIMNTQLCHHGTAFERFTPWGALALLPFGPKRAKMVWSQPVVTAQRMQKDAAYLEQAVQRAFGYRLGRLQLVGPVLNYPLKQVRAKKIVAKGVVLVGNSANTLHPVAAQGLNLGLRDVRDLAQWLQQRYDQDYTTEEALQAFASLRKRDHFQTSTFCHVLSQWFEESSWWAKLSRRMGIIATGIVPTVNHTISAIGLGKYRTTHVEAE